MRHCATIRARGRRPSAPRPGGVGHQHGGRAVGDLRGRPRGVQAVLDHRLEPGQGVQAGLAQPFVAVDHPARRFHRRDLPAEPSLRPGGPCQGLRAEAQGVDLRARQAAAPGDSLRGDELVRQVDVPGVRPRRADPGAHVGAQRHARHGLHPAADADGDRVGRDEAGDQVDRVLGGAALGVQREAARLVGQAGVQPRGPGDVVRLLARLRHAAAGDLLNRRGRDARPVEQRALGRAEDLGGVQAREHAAAPADRCAHSLDDHRGTHQDHLLAVRTCCLTMAPVARL